MYDLVRLTLTSGSFNFTLDKDQRLNRLRENAFEWSGIAIEPWSHFQHNKMGIDFGCKVGLVRLCHCFLHQWLSGSSNKSLPGPLRQKEAGHCDGRRAGGLLRGQKRQVRRQIRPLPRIRRAQVRICILLLTF